MSFSTPHETARRVVDATLYLRKMLGVPILPGVVLLERHFAGEPWATVQEVAERSLVSADTIRRRLNELVAVDRAEVETEGGRTRYRINPKTAASLIDGLVLLGATVEEVPASSQTATAICD